MEDKLGIFLRRFKENVRNFYNIPDIVKFLKTEIDRKRKIYPFWKKKVRFSYTSYKKQHPKILNQSPKTQIHKNILQYFYHDDHLSKDKHIPDENISKIIPLEQPFISLRFFKKKFFDLFSYFLTELLPFEKKSLTLTQHPINVYWDLFFDIQYEFSDAEIQSFADLKLKYSIIEKTEKIIEYFFSSIIHIFGMEIGDIITDNYQVELISGVAHLKTTKRLNFTISIRQKERILKDFFLNSHIYQFSEYFPQIPSVLKNKLKMQNDLIYLLSLERYFDLNPYIISVLARIYKKCVTLGHITPVLDILNFMFSRVEDSIYSTQEILENVANKITPLSKKKSALLQIFEFCNKNAVLFGTFQSNNRSQLQEQYRLFFLYNLQFFGAGGMEQNFRADVLFLPAIFNDEINILKQNFPSFHNYFSLFEKFLHTSFEISTNPAFTLVFKHIFVYNVEDMNEDFFSAFITSLNQRLFQEIEQHNKQLNSDSISYSEAVNFIIKTIYHSIRTIFLAEDPLQASKNFRDSISRYSPKNIALRSMELLFFKEIPLSDNNWMIYNLSRNKEKVINQFKDHLHIPKDYFFSPKKLLHISMKQFYSLESEIVLEKWFVDFIISPFVKFIDGVYQQIQKNKLDINKSNINAELHRQLARGIINSQTLDNLELICERMAESFSEVKF